MNSISRALALRTAWLAVIVVVAGCSGLATITGGATPPPTASPTASPMPTPHPWPAKFEKNFCAGIAKITSAVPDLNKVGEAADADDFAGVSRYAKATIVKFKAADAAMKLGPAWKPATDMVAKFRKALKTYIAALTDVDKGARTRSTTLLLRAVRALPAGNTQMTAAGAAAEALRLATGFDCPQP